MRAFRSHLRHAVLALAALSACGAARAEGVDCELGFSLANWLVSSQSATGVGTLHCSDNESMVVRIKVKGAGITAQTRGINSGHARFSQLRRIHDALGTYLANGSDASDTRAADTQVLSKGNGIVTLHGREGWDRGVTFNAMELLARPLKTWRK